MRAELHQAAGGLSSPAGVVGGWEGGGGVALVQLNKGGGAE